jgi:hypothetical protein
VRPKIDNGDHVVVGSVQPPDSPRRWRVVLYVAFPHRLTEHAVEGSIPVTIQPRVERVGSEKAQCFADLLSQDRIGPSAFDERGDDFGCLIGPKHFHAAEGIMIVGQFAQMWHLPLD